MRNHYSFSAVPLPLIRDIIGTLLFSASTIIALFLKVYYTFFCKKEKYYDDINVSLQNC